MRAGVVFICALALGSAGLAAAQQPDPTVQPRQRARGYLTPETTPEAAKILPPPPVAGTERDNLDRAIFKQSRALKDSPRWKLAQADNGLSMNYLTQAFSCSIGSKLTPESAPITSRILSRLIVDAGASSGTAKDVFKRRRPFLIDEGEICIPRSRGIEASLDYPSGHTTIGWAAGLILAQLAPDRADAILSRGRAYGESRAVCGVHNASAVEAGRTTGSIVVAALNGSPEFRSDMDQARVEIARLRADPANAVDAAACQAEAELIATAPYLK
jgi:acid phosphatase (class A)